MFEVNEFLTATNDVVLDDHIIPIPPGEYTAQVALDEKSIQIEPGESDDKENPGQKKPWAQASVRLELLDPSGEVAAKIGRKPVIVYRFFLDLTPQGKFDYAPQRNVRMGALLKAVGMNQPGWKFNEIKGKTLKVKVAGVKDNRDPSVVRSEVVQVGMAG